MLRKILILLIITFFVTSCSEEEKAFAQVQIIDAFPNLEFTYPVDIQQSGDGTNRLFIVGQEGTIWVVENDPATDQKKVFLDIEDKTLYGGEQGLLGLAFHPDYENNGYFYIDYSRSSPRRNVIARYSADPDDPDKADPDSEFVIMEVEQPYSNHNGGQISFGPDGYLYISFGDGGSGGDPLEHGENPKTILGSIVRIDVNNTEDGNNYAIPADNYFKDNDRGFAEEIYAYGLRNVWRFSWDSQTGLLYAADVGQNKWEEISILENGGNYGWDIMEGFHCFEPGSNCDTTGLILPIHEYSHDMKTGGLSISGGFVYRGSNVPFLAGKYVYADYVSGNIWALEYDGSEVVSNEKIFDSNYNITAFGVDKDRELYFGDFRTSKIYKFAPETTGQNGMGMVNPADFKLEQNYPNPFNPSTNIGVYLPEREFITLNIYDILGRKVDNLYTGTVQGYNEFTWNAGGHSGGTYFYTLLSDDYRASGKMTLLK